MVRMWLAGCVGDVCELVWVLTDVVVIVTHPFLTAIVPRFDQPRLQALPARQGYLLRTEGHTAHHSVYTRALVLAAEIEVLTVLVQVSVELTGQTMSFSCQRAHKIGNKAMTGETIGNILKVKMLCSFCNLMGSDGVTPGILSRKKIKVSPRPHGDVLLYK